MIPGFDIEPGPLTHRLDHFIGALAGERACASRTGLFQMPAIGSIPASTGAGRAPSSSAASPTPPPRFVPGSSFAAKCCPSTRRSRRCASTPPAMASSIASPMARPRHHRSRHQRSPGRSIAPLVARLQGAQCGLACSAQWRLVADSIAAAYSDGRRTARLRRLRERARAGADRRRPHRQPADRLPPLLHRWRRPALSQARLCCRAGTPPTRSLVRHLRPPSLKTRSSGSVDPVVA